MNWTKWRNIFGSSDEQASMVSPVSTVSTPYGTLTTTGVDQYTLTAQQALLNQALYMGQQGAANTAAGGIGQLGGIGTAGTANYPFGIQQTTVTPPRDFRMVTTQADLDHAVFKTPIETLVNLWLAKFGSDWVDKNDVFGDEFFEWAALRLRSTGRLEEHTIHTPPASVSNNALTAYGVPKTVVRVVSKD